MLGTITSMAYAAVDVILKLISRGAASSINRDSVEKIVREILDRHALARGAPSVNINIIIDDVYALVGNDPRLLLVKSETIKPATTIESLSDQERLRISLSAANELRAIISQRRQILSGDGQ